MKWNMILIAALLVASCTPIRDPTSSELPPDTAVTSPSQDNPSTTEPMKNPFSPQLTDAKLTRGNVFIEESGVMIRESYPPQISLNISGNLPTPCHQLRAKVSSPDAGNKINVDAYTVVDPNLVCVQVLKPFTASIDLGIFPAGHFTVWVNGESAGEFDS